MNQGKTWRCNFDWCALWVEKKKYFWLSPGSAFFHLSENLTDLLTCLGPRCVLDIMNLITKEGAAFHTESKVLNEGSLRNCYKYFGKSAFFNENNYK
jgi:hypothetical protein